MIHDSAQRFGLVSIFLHWVMAALIIGLLALGLFMIEQKTGPLRSALYSWHKSLGVAVLILVIGRLGWRFHSVRPGALPHYKRWEIFLAGLVQRLLYLAMLIMPLSGWAMSSAKGYPVKFFGLFSLPALVPESKALVALAQDTHEIAAWALIFLILLHFLSAIKHHFINRDETIRRMLP